MEVRSRKKYPLLHCYTEEVISWWLSGREILASGGGTGPGLGDYVPDGTLIPSPQPHCNIYIPKMHYLVSQKIRITFLHGTERTAVTFLSETDAFLIAACSAILMDWAR